MHPSMQSNRYTTFIMATLALALGSGSMQATNLLTATPSTVNLTCSTTTGVGQNVSVVVKPAPALSGSATIVVTVGALPGGVTVTAPSVTTLSTSNQTAGLTYTVNLSAGCVGANAGSA